MRGKTAEDQRLLELLDPVAEAAGYAIVRLRLTGGLRRTLQIMGEDAHGDMTIDGCTTLSRRFSEVLEATDPITGEYVLEVSTPGVDRPLTRLADFATHAGLEARVELDRLAEGRKRFKGVIAGVEDDGVLLDQEGEETTTVVPFAWIADAKLVMSDELMKRGAETRAGRLAREAAEPDEEEEQS